MPVKRLLYLFFAFIREDLTDKGDPGKQATQAEKAAKYRERICKVQNPSGN